MTLRRWQEGEDTDRQGPAETDVRAELETLGWNPLTPAGPLRTAAVRACLLAETLDHSQNAAALPALDRQLSNVMAEARQAAKSGAMTEEDEETREEEVSDFEARRRRRMQGGT